MKNLLQNFALGKGFLKALMLLTLVLGAWGCTDEAEVAPDQGADLAGVNLYEALGRVEGNEVAAANAKGKRPSFSTLKVALAKAGLMGTVASERLTLFAPTDEAFAALGITKQNVGSVPNLKEILLYHAVAGEVYARDLSAGFVPTLNGAAVEIKLNGGVMVNGASVMQADIRALNGVIHAIDQVLLPPDKNLVQLALSLNPEFSVLVAAVQKADLVDALAKGGPYTVFAPTNAAFVALLEELGFSSLDDIPVPVLTQVLLYHVVEGRVYSSDLTSGEVRTLEGSSFMLSTSSLSITDFYGREAGLVPALLNVQATNGVVHVIDRVILPDLGL